MAVALGRRVGLWQAAGRFRPLSTLGEGRRWMLRTWLDGGTTVGVEGDGGKGRRKRGLLSVWLETFLVFI